MISGESGSGAIVCFMKSKITFWLSLSFGYRIAKTLIEDLSQADEAPAQRSIGSWRGQYVATLGICKEVRDKCCKNRTSRKTLV